MYNFVRAGGGAGVLKSLICTIYRSKTETCFVVCCQISKNESSKENFSVEYILNVFICLYKYLCTNVCMQI